MTSVDPAREATIHARRETVEAAFSASAEREADGRFALVQPLRIHVLMPTP